MLEIEIKFPFYYLITSENGRELEKQKFQDVDMLLYIVFEIFNKIEEDLLFLDGNTLNKLDFSKLKNFDIIKTNRRKL